MTCVNKKKGDFRYVDDCFVLGENKKDIDEIFNVLYKTHSSITFTVEKGNKDELGFLDVQVKRQRTDSWHLFIESKPSLEKI